MLTILKTTFCCYRWEGITSDLQEECNEDVVAFLSHLVGQYYSKRMTSMKKGILSASGEWAKHLRKFKKRKFWKRERHEGKKLTKSEENDAPMKALDFGK